MDTQADFQKQLDDQWVKRRDGGQTGPPSSRALSAKQALAAIFAFTVIVGAVVLFRPSSDPVQPTATTQPTTRSTIMVVTPSDEQIKTVLTRVAPSATPVVVVITATPDPTAPPTWTPIPTNTFTPTATFTPTSTPSMTPTPSVVGWCVAKSQQWLLARPSEDVAFQAGFVRQGDSVGLLAGVAPQNGFGWVLIRRGDAETRGWLRLNAITCP